MNQLHLYNILSFAYSVTFVKVNITLINYEFIFFLSKRAKIRYNMERMCTFCRISVVDFNTMITINRGLLNHGLAGLNF